METINLSDIVDETTKPPPPSVPIAGDKRDSNVTIKTPSLAVHMKNVSLNYGTSLKPLIALNSVNVHIPEGIIYGLLGPSGCGKTTLLRCILGRLKPQSGDIKIFGYKPGTQESLVPGPGVGYMPQELALYMQFTVKETINYFGQLTGIPKEERHSRVEFLLSFLDLTDADRMVSDLSGGQRRRVSLAVALVHKPPLLILDEPTVGVDPLLRESIWSHLVQLTQSEGMTAIITTHYIEEARQANVVGLMREGSLLVEENPECLMLAHQKDTLEGIFLKICHEQRTSSGSTNSFIKENGGISPATIKNIRKRQSIEQSTKEVKWRRPRPEPLTGKPEMFKDAFRKIGALTEKMAIRLRRNIPMLTFQLVLPTIQIILFCICIGQEPKNLDLAVFNQDTSGANYSQKYLELVDPNYVKINYFNSKEEALNQVKEGWAHGALIFNPNYSLQLDNRFDMFEMMTDARYKIINDSTIYYHSDGTEFPIQITMLTQLVTSAQKWIINLVNESFPFMASAIAEPLFKPVDPPIYGELKPSYRNFMAPGLILGISYILAVGLTALCFVMDRKEGLLERTFVAGVDAYQILFAHIIIQCTIILIQTILLLFTIFVIFQIDLNGSIISVTILTLLQGITGMSFGFLISALCYEEQSAMLISVGSFYPNLILCGILWPLEAMPEFMRDMSYLMPQTLAIKSMRYIITRGWDFTRFEVYIGFFSTGCWIIIFNILAVIIFAVKK